MTYAEKIKDPRWQKKRLEVMSRDSFACNNCGETKEQLHVHHLVYSGLNPWDAESEHLLTLCKSCHEKEEQMVKYVKEQIKNLTLSCGTIEPIYNYIKEFMNYAE